MSASSSSSSSSASPRSALYSRAAYSQLSAADACAILSHYASPSSGERLLSHHELSGGLSNSNYRLQTTARSLLCKLCDEKTAEELLRQIRALLQLRPHGLPIAYPIERADAAAGESEAERCLLLLPPLKPVVLYQFLHGTMPGTARPALMRQLATAQAALHLVDGRDFAFLPPFPMGLAQMRPFLECELPRLSAAIQSHPFVSFLRSEVELLQAPVTHPSLPPPCVLHGDLFLENCIVSIVSDDELQGCRLVGIVDWEEMCLGCHLLDAAMTLVGCAYDEQDELQAALASAYLAAYHRTRPLTALDAALFPSFLRYACLSIAFWRFRQFNVRVPDEQRREAYAQMQRRIVRLQQPGQQDEQRIADIMQRLRQQAAD